MHEKPVLKNELYEDEGLLFVGQIRKLIELSGQSRPKGMLLNLKRVILTKVLVSLLSLTILISTDYLRQCQTQDELESR